MAYNYEFTLTSVNPAVFSPQFYIPEMTVPEYTDDDEPSYYTFTSEHLNELTDAQEVWAEVNSYWLWRRIFKIRKSSQRA